MAKEKYALFDTDFISKTHLIRQDEQNKMIDRVMEMQGYRFFCHEQIRTELKRHNIGNSPEWLEARISYENKIDKIREELADVVNYCVLMADVCGLDLDEIVQEKIKRNDEKYPVEKAKGSKEKYDKFQDPSEQRE